MTFTTEIKTNYLLVTFEGPLGEDAPTRFPEQLIEAAIAHQNPRMLVDLRKVEGTLTTLERYTMGEAGAQKFSAALGKREIPICWFSLVANEPLMAPDKFGETVANNRGMLIRIFSDYQEALDWLLRVSVPADPLT